jgi:hypothetical protein
VQRREQLLRLLVRSACVDAVTLVWPSTHDEDRPGSVPDAPVILIDRGVQAHLLELLGVDETRPRWLGT